MRLKEALIYCTAELSKAEIEQPALEARILLGHLLAKSQEYVISHSEELIHNKDALQELIRRRQALEPIAYITGKREFFGRDFVVDKNVLIPRPDSETLIEAVLKNSRGATRILELGTGSGCLIITLLIELPKASGIGLDIDNNALTIAQANINNYKLQERLLLLESNWFRALAQEKFDIIISNPPYISKEETIARETFLHEPHQALFAEENGMAAYVEIISKAREFLKPEGMIYLEIGHSQSAKVGALLGAKGYEIYEEYKDLSGHIRCLAAKVIF